MAVIMERLTEILIDQYQLRDESEFDLSSVREDTHLDSDDLVRGYSSDSLLRWPDVPVS